MKLFYHLFFSLLLASVASASAFARTSAWLDTAIIYQIYPSSFMDTDGDGIGDLRGIRQRLDYLSYLGVNTIWLNPVFCSAWQDGGYDVTDFYQVDPRFGNNQDLLQLINEAHLLGMRVCLDLVAGHTSDQHPWFKASAKSAEGQYADYYMWTDSINDAERATLERRHRTHDPAIATWGSYGLADAPHAKYYRKNYFEHQPALNYGFVNPNPSDPEQQAVDAPGPRAVRRQLQDIMAYWLDRGVDGFRIDMASSLIKGDDDNKTANVALWKDMRQWLDRHYPNCLLIAEWSQPAQSLAAGFDLDFMIHFGLRGFDALCLPAGAPDAGDYDYCYFDASGKGSYAPFVNNYQPVFRATRNLGYITIPTSNHDVIRPNNGNRNSIDQLKVWMLFCLTMPGPPCIYYGDEIGMKYQPDAPNKEGANHRAGSRTPMQWSTETNAGFSTCTPSELYLPIDTQQGRLTVQTQKEDSASLLSFTRNLIALRKQIPALTGCGDWQLVSSPQTPYPMIYVRSLGDDFVVVALNPSASSVTAQLPHLPLLGKLIIESGQCVYMTGGSTDTVTLAPFSGAILQ